MSSKEFKMSIAARWALSVWFRVNVNRTIATFMEIWQVYCRALPTSPSQIELVYFSCDRQALFCTWHAFFFQSYISRPPHYRQVYERRIINKWNRFYIAFIFVFRLHERIYNFHFSLTEITTSSPTGGLQFIHETLRKFDTKFPIFGRKMRGRPHGRVHKFSGQWQTSTENSHCAEIYENSSSVFFCRSLRSRQHNRTKRSERLEVMRMWKMYFFSREGEKLEISAAARHTRSFGAEEKKKELSSCALYQLWIVCGGCVMTRKPCQLHFSILVSFCSTEFIAFHHSTSLRLSDKLCFVYFFIQSVYFCYCQLPSFNCCSMHDPSSFSAKLEKHLNEQVHFLKEVQSSMQLQNQPSYPSPSSLARPSTTKLAASTAAAAYKSLQSSKNGQRPPTRARPEAVTVVNKLTNHKKTSAAATMMNATTINKGGKKVCDEFGLFISLSLCWAVFLALMTMTLLLLSSNQISPHHLNDDELLPHNNDAKLFADDAISFYSVPSSFADSASTVISFKGKSMETNCAPQQLILFLVNELKTKVKLSHGAECELLRFFREVSIRFNFPPPSQTTTTSRSTSSNSIMRLNEHSPSKLWKIPTTMGWTHREPKQSCQLLSN